LAPVVWAINALRGRHLAQGRAKMTTDKCVLRRKKVCRPMCACTLFIGHVEYVHKCFFATYILHWAMGIGSHCSCFHCAVCIVEMCIVTLVVGIACTFGLCIVHCAVWALPCWHCSMCQLGLGIDRHLYFHAVHHAMTCHLDRICLGW